MAFLTDDVLDSGLNVLSNAIATLHFCSSQPTSLAQVSSTTLANKSSLAISAPSDRPGGGRRVTIAAFTDGQSTVGSGAQATHWAIVDGTRLLATNVLAAPFLVNPGANNIPLEAFDIGIPDAVSA